MRFVPAQEVLTVHSVLTASSNSVAERRMRPRPCSAMDASFGSARARS